MTNFGFEALGSISGGLNYLGTWDAALNIPLITSGVGTAGDYYIVSVGGTTNIDGISDWGVGDWIVFSSSGVWQKIDNSDLEGYNLIQDEGTSLPKQTIIDFQGAGVTASNDLLNNKTVVTIPATVSSVGLTTGTTGTDVNITGSPVTGSGSLNLNIPTASATNRGALSNTDWSTFNGKQNALVSGTNIKTVQSTSILGSGDVTITDANLSTSDITTNNVSTTKHGFAPKAPNDGTQFLDGTGAYDTVKDSDLSLSDITTNNVSTTRHGFVPKAPNNTTTFLRGDGTWATPATGGTLTVGTSAITSGTVGRILFEGTGNVLQEDSALFWDNTNKRLGVGATPSTSVRLDVRAQGALSTDIAFRVRNSADTDNLLTLQGDGFFGVSAVPSDNIISATALESGTLVSQFTDTSKTAAISVVRSQFNEGSIYISSKNNTAWNHAKIWRVSNLNRLHINATTPGSAQTQTGSEIRLQDHLVITRHDFRASLKFGSSASMPATSNGEGVLQIQKAFVNPSNNIAGCFVMYGADIVAGNAAPHFRTENGNIIKIYQETTGVAAATLVGGGGTTLTDTDTFDGYTIAKVVKALRNLGILA